MKPRFPFHSVFLVFLFVWTTSSSRRSAVKISRTTLANENILDRVEDSSDNSFCPACNSRILKRTHRLENIKYEILRKLRMASPPNVTGVRMPDVPHLRSIIEKVEHETRTNHLSYSGENEMATTIKIFRISQLRPSPNPDPSVVYFNLSSRELRHPAQVVNATFCIYIRKLDYVDTTWQTYILIYRARDRFLMARKKITYADTGRWISFNVTSVVQQWVRDSESNHGLDILCTDNSGQPLAIIHPRSLEETSNRSYLHMDIIGNNNMRKRRTAESNMNCEEYSRETMCCRYPLQVNFTEFGWDWVIFPKSYDAYFCSGDCPVMMVDGHVYSAISQQSSGRGFKGMCCSPKITSSISMLYYDDKMNIVYGRLPGMVVEKCGCS